MEQKNMYSDEYAVETQPTLKELMARITQLESKKATQKPQPKVKLHAKKINNARTEQIKKSVKWHQEHRGLTVVESGFTVKRNTKTFGEKTYDAVRFSDGKIGIILDSGIITTKWV
jgi:putative SOS response-associated peptidase YedK